MSPAPVPAEGRLKMERGDKLFVVLRFGFKFRSVQSFKLPQLPLTPSKAPEVFSRQLD